jgi:hypothetical protein
MYAVYKDMASTQAVLHTWTLIPLMFSGFLALIDNLSLRVF